MKKCAFFLTNIFIIVIVTCTTVLSQIPYKLSYQGILTDTLGYSLADGEWGITFRLYDSHAGGNQLWTESKQIQTNRGLFSTILGDVNSLEGATRFDKPYWLSLQLSGQSEMLPRIQLTAVGYSLNSIRSDTAKTVISIPDGIVTESKIANNTISSQKIVDGTISTADIANNSITTTKIASGQVVKSLNNLKDNIILSAEGGASITSSGDTIKINAGSGGGGTGIQGVQNTNNTLNITNPNGPTATINLKVPLTLSDSLQNTAYERGVFKTSNHGTGSAIYGVQTSSGKSIYGLNTGTGKAGVFSIENASNTQVALTGETNGTGRAIFANQTGTGRALHAQINNASNSQAALTGETNGSGTAVNGSATSASGATTGVYGLSASTSGRGVIGFASASSGTTYGILGQTNSPGGYGVYGLATSSSGSNYGLYGESNSSTGRGVQGVSPYLGTYGRAEATTGVNYGVYGRSNSTEGYGVFGINAATTGYNYGIYGETNSPNGRAVYGLADGTTGSAFGVYGNSKSANGTGVYGVCNGAGGYGVFGSAITGYAGYFAGRVNVEGTLSKGAGSFKIDHPLDPENKYLYHSFVESPDMMNIYNGNIVLNERGEATILLPDWFDALNKDFRYQLTCIGGFANIYIAEKVNKNKFKIAGGYNGLEVSWQVTGIRKDAFAEKNRIPVEEDKIDNEKGKYIHPEAFGLSKKHGINELNLQHDDTSENKIIE